MSALTFPLCTLLALGIAATAAAGLKCDAVRTYFEAQGFPPSDIPKEPISSRELKTCGGVSSGGEVCCSADMELRLQARAKDKHEKATRDSLHRWHQIFATRATKFHDFFKDLLAASKKGFHEMFKRTYGVIYEQNAYLFTDLFKELENYYARGTVNLEDAMDNFFNVLYQKMFTVMNSQYQFDDKYLECVGDHMKEMSPFGDVPQKLSVQIKRSFVATRAFSQSLNVAADVLKNMQTLRSSPECAAALTRMTACPSCSGIPGNVLACTNMCSNVMKGCLAQHAALDVDWNHFVEAVDKVAERLLGPFNIEVVVEPIDIKISEAIMNFQESGADVSQRVFSGCGKPILGKRRRRDSRELQLESLNFNQASSAEDRAPTAAMMDKLVKEIRQRIRDSRQFWTLLPYQLCNNGLVVPPSNTKECWNGTHIDQYIYPVSSSGEIQTLNPEVQASGPKATVVKEQLYALSMISNRLRLAFNGQDVDWIDTEETGYGSGSGSGDGGDDDDGRIDDDFEDENIEGGDVEGRILVEGSGYETSTNSRDNQDAYNNNNNNNNNNKQQTTTTILGKDESPVVPPKIDTSVTTKSKPGANNKTLSVAGSGNGVYRPKMSLTRALTTYLFPIAVMWFGGCLTEWL
ncbi:glypican-4 [Neodiprion fabricii]|uniref:glypican-4 n=1 Tax=Neodiprion fabricii TaxID=2872261 RepID=UPI001ED8D19E|nr:glypican-4 [Neodiprion fabricii]